MSGSTSNVVDDENSSQTGSLETPIELFYIIQMLSSLLIGWIAMLAEMGVAYGTDLDPCSLKPF
jgi:hypothetical protein